MYRHEQGGNNECRGGGGGFTEVGGSHMDSGVWPLRLARGLPPTRPLSKVWPGHEKRGGARGGGVRWLWDGHRCNLVWVGEGGGDGTIIFRKGLNLRSTSRQVWGFRMHLTWNDILNISLDILPPFYVIVCFSLTCYAFRHGIHVHIKNYVEKTKCIVTPSNS